jgi:predicted O-methyltransferase YrrM
MDFLPEKISSYVDAHSDAEPDLLYRLHRETWQKVVMPRMLSGHFQGRFLAFLSRLLQPERILEIGSYTGYSAICLCEGLRPNGRMDAVEINPELNSIQDKYWIEAGIRDKITRYNGAAADILPTLDGGYDLIFLDADKENYPIYYEACLNLLRTGGVLLIDNVLWTGKVVEPVTKHDPETKALQALNDTIAQDARVSKLMLPIRDGVFAIMKNA